MKFLRTDIEGVFEIEATPHGDERGSFARLFCPDEFLSAGIDFAPVQINLSSNPLRGTLRGMHFQKPPFAEAKVVRVVRGKAWDVALDLRPGRGQGRWIARELSPGNLRALYLPEGIAHGFLTMEPDTDILYLMGHEYVPGHADGVRWDDPAFGITWPAEPKVLSDKDRAWAGFRERTDLR